MSRDSKISDCGVWLPPLITWPNTPNFLRKTGSCDTVGTNEAKTTL